MTAFSTPQRNAHHGIPALLARYRNGVDARRAVRTLETTGVDEQDLTVVGPAAEKPTSLRALRRRVRSSVGLSFFVGLVLGTLLGAAIGLAAMWIILAVTPNVSGAGSAFTPIVWWFTAQGALFGAVGAVMRARGLVEPMPLTQEGETDAPVWLAVYGRPDAVRSDVEATHPERIVDDPVVTAHPDELIAHPS
ncbi:MAG TPA: hypothetical protein VFZ17_12760 [Acidimicrobiia bacterium]|nr:hypothetical protein [Acidimicrobiia bacterium]